MKIVSLLPSATEIICRLDLQSSLIGISHECDYPFGIEHLPKLTATSVDKLQSSQVIDQQVKQAAKTSKGIYSLDLDLLAALAPDIILSQSLCDVCAVSADDIDEALAGLPNQPKLINLQSFTLNDVLDTILLVAKETGKELQADKFLQEATRRINAVHAESDKLIAKPRVAFLEWLDPLFNSGHWTPELIELAGGVDCFGALHRPSVEKTFAQLVEAGPDIVVVGLCGFDVSRTEQILVQTGFLQRLNTVHAAAVYVVNGNWYFNRPGPRLIDSLEIMQSIMFDHCGLEVLGSKSFIKVS